MMESPSGFWGPVPWIVATVVSVVIACLIRTRGEKGHKRGVQGEAFLMGNPRLPQHKSHVRAHNIYWGFFQGLRRYYDHAKTMHTGIINDYLIWFVSFVAITLIIVFVAELI